MRVLALYKGDCQPPIRVPDPRNTVVGRVARRVSPRRQPGSSQPRSAAGDGGDDADGDPVRDLGGESVEVADVVVIHEDVHELAEATVLVEETVGEPGVGMKARCSPDGENETNVTGSKSRSNLGRPGDLTSQTRTQPSLLHEATLKPSREIAVPQTSSWPPSSSTL